MNKKTNTLLHDFFASIVVFLVALPLCMGIAIASGVPAYAGLIAGIIGGLVVGSLAGAPMQVSGPAAGLAVMVYDFAQTHGPEALIPLGVIIGITQLTAAYFRVGLYFKATSPALIKGLLSGIGVLIFSSQFHIMLDHKTKKNGLDNLFSIPNDISDIFQEIANGVVHHAAILGIITILIIIIWNEMRWKWTKSIPAPLLAVVGASFLASNYHFPVKFVELPESLFGHVSFGNIGSAFGMVDFNFILSGIGMAFVASAETLLCVTAVDKLTKTSSRYNKEMMAQGVGNAISGLLGGLPITGVIVRSSANVESGGKTRLSAILHGAWLMLLLLIFPQVLSLIPMSVLAGILVFTGWKLMNIPAIPRIYARGKGQLAIYLITVGTIVGKDLLTGVVIGFIVSLFVLVVELLEPHVAIEEKDGEHLITFRGRVSFLNLPALSNKLDEFKPAKGENVTVDLKEVEYLDHAIEEHLDHWVEKLESLGHKVDYKKNH